MKEGNFDIKPQNSEEEAGYSIGGGERRPFIEEKREGKKEIKPVENNLPEVIGKGKSKEEALKDLFGSLGEAKRQAVEDLDPEERKEFEEKNKSFRELLESLENTGLDISVGGTGSEETTFSDMGDFFYLYIPVPESVRKIDFPNTTNPTFRIKIPK